MHALHAPTPPRLLVAEDDHDLRCGIAQLLAREGYHVHAVSNGLDVLDYLAAWILAERASPPVDLIVTDVRMPGVNGLTIVEGLRASGWRQPIIVISAFGDDGMRDRLARLRDVVFMSKPFDPGELEQTIARLV